MAPQYGIVISVHGVVRDEHNVELRKDLLQSSYAFVEIESLPDVKREELVKEYIEPSVVPLAMKASEDFTSEELNKTALRWFEKLQMESQAVGTTE
jgi:hypothetical protein